MASWTSPTPRSVISILLRSSAPPLARSSFRAGKYATYLAHFEAIFAWPQDGLSRRKSDALSSYSRGMKSHECTTETGSQMPRCRYATRRPGGPPSRLVDGAALSESPTASGGGHGYYPFLASLWLTFAIFSIFAIASSNANAFTPAPANRIAYANPVIAHSDGPVTGATSCGKLTPRTGCFQPEWYARRCASGHHQYRAKR